MAAFAATPVRAADVNLSYAVADSGDTLVEMNRFDGSAFRVIGNTGTSNIEAISWDIGATNLYAADAGQFGFLNLTTGAFTPIGSGFGTAGGLIGGLPVNVTINDVDGLTMDPLTGILYGSHRRGGATENDLLIQIDATTGAHVPNAFGPGIDYLEITTNTIPVTPLIYDVDDIAIDPLDGQMYGVANTAGGDDRLVKIDKFTGAVTDVDRLQLPDTTPVSDVEGFSFFNDGTFYSTTGDTTPTNDSLWVVDTTNAVMTLIGAFGSGTDYEAVGDLTAPANTISGTAFLDADLDGIYNGSDTPEQNVTVKLYLDVNGDGMVDGGDILIQTKQSAADGTYQFLLGAQGNFVVEVDETTFPPAKTGMSTPVEHGVSFIGFGNASVGNDFGYITVGAIGDTIFWDLDKDGMQDPGEPGIPGVDVIIDTPTMGQTTVTTNEFGIYLFPVTETGAHTVTVDTSTLPFPFPQTADPDATLDDQTTVTIVAVNDVVLTADFGYELRTLDKQLDRALASDGDTITYTLRPRYQFDDPLTSVVVRDDVPVGTTFSTAGQGGAHDAGMPGTVTWTLGSNVAGTPGVITGTTGSVNLTADADTWMDQGKPDDLYGSDTDMRVKLVGGDNERALVHFNVAGAGIPVGSRIDAATMSFYVATNKTTTVGIHRLTHNWTEGGATWNTSGAGAWTAAGATGDYIVTPETTFIPDTKNVYVDSSVVWLSKYWFENPASNFGCILVNDNNQEPKFSTREAGGEEPKLLIEYTTPTLTNTIIPNASMAVTGDSVVVTMTLTSNVDIAGVAPTLNRVGTNGMSATLDSGPTPASHNITAGIPVVFTWAYTVTEGGGATPGQLTFDGDATGTTGSGPLTFASATSASVIASPLLTMQVTVDGGATSPLSNTGEIESTDTGMGPFIPSTNSNTVQTVLTPAAIGNRLWLDEDGDGVQDAGEDGIAGITVELLDDMMVVIATAVTDHEGGYLFTGLTGGTYTVRVDTATLPAGLDNQTGDPDATFDDEHTVAVVAGDEYLTADFGYNWVPAADTIAPSLGTTGAIGDRLWIDADGDGTQDAGEAGIPGVTVRLLTDDNGDGVYGGAGDSPAVTTMTDGTGHYIFDALDPAGYVVEVVAGTLPAGYTQTGDPDATLDHKSDPLPLAPGDVIVIADFGYQPAAGSAIGDTIYFDADADSTQDAGEPGIAGVTVALVDAGGNPLATMVTDAGGNYLFPGLPAGTYSVVITDTENVLGDLASTEDPDGGADRTSTTVVNGTADDLAQDFGFTPQGHATGEGLIGDTVFLDRDADGFPDAGEGIEGVRVDLYGSEGIRLIASVRTDENGKYAFGDLDPNVTYTVLMNTADLPAGVTNTADPYAGTASDTVIDLSASGGLDLDQDFGYRDLTSPNAIGGTVWVDTDADGTLDEAGTGIPGAKIVLRDSGGNIVGTTTTNGSGDYLFSNLPDGTYTVDVVDEANEGAGVWKSNGPNPGADNNSQVDPYSVTVTGGQTNTTGDFGFYDGPASIGNFVFNDLDKDGIQDVGEPGIAGVKVTLLITYPTTDDVILVTTTDASGMYTFGNLLLDENLDGVGTPSVDEPVYTVSVTPPPGGTPSPNDVGGDDTVDSDNGAIGETAEPVQGGADTTNDFGFYGVKLQKNYSNWADFNGLTGPDAPPTANPDNDLYSNLIEYAFCLDPKTGVDSDKNFCVAESTTTPGQVDAFFTRAAGLTDLTYTLEGLADLATSPGGWADTGLVPAVVSNGDGTETVTYANIESVPALSGGIGFVRIKVDLSSPVTTAYTQVFGWERTTTGVQCETLSEPFLEHPTFSGVVDSMSGTNLEVASSAGTGDVRAAMDAMKTYYVEVIAGADEGHRFEVEYAFSDADTIVIDSGSIHNTKSPLPDLTGQTLILRAFRTLGQLFDIAEFNATNDPDTADRLLFRMPGDAGIWQVYWAMDDTVNPVQWTLQGEVGMPDRGGRLIDPCEGMFVHPRAASETLLFVGVVRANDFACPLLEGSNLVAGGWAIEQSPDGRDMEIAAGFFSGSTNPADTDRTFFWLGDTTPGDEGYGGYFLLDGGAPYQRWVDFDDSSVTSQDATALFHSNRAALIDVTSDRLNYVMPQPWTP